MRLNKTQKRGIVEDYARHVYLQPLEVLLSKINKEIKSLLEAEYKPHERAINNVAFPVFKELTSLKVTTTMSLRMHTQAEKMKKKDANAMHGILCFFYKDSGSPLILSKSWAFLTKIKNYANKKENNKYIEYLDVYTTTKRLDPKDDLLINHENVNDPKFKKLMDLGRQVNTLVEEAAIHLDQVEQLIESVTTDNKLLELLPDMVQFIPNKQSSVQLIPSQTISDIKAKLSK